MALLRFIGSQPGRFVRAAAGLALIGTGVLLGGGWLALAVVGLLPLAAGVFDVCVLGPLFRLPFAGPAFRAAAGGR
jgi:hypothetical protein